jgi:hypothetical protein
MQSNAAFRGWARLVGEVVCDFLFLSLWLVLAWAIHECVERQFPLHGMPFYVGSAIEGVLDISILIKLYRLRLGPRSGGYFRQRQ